MTLGASLKQVISYFILAKKAEYVLQKITFLRVYYTGTKKYPHDRDFLSKISTVLDHFLKKYSEFRNVVYLEGKP